MEIVDDNKLLLTIVRWDWVCLVERDAFVGAFQRANLGEYCTNAMDQPRHKFCKDPEGLKHDKYLFELPSNYQLSTGKIYAKPTNEQICKLGIVGIEHDRFNHPGATNVHYYAYWTVVREDVPSEMRGGVVEEQSDAADLVDMGTSTI